MPSRGRYSWSLPSCLDSFELALRFAFALNSTESSGVLSSVCCPRPIMSAGSCGASDYRAGSAGIHDAALMPCFRFSASIVTPRNARHISSVVASPHETVSAGSSG